MDTDSHGYVGGWRFEVGVFASRLCPQSSNAYFICVHPRPITVFLSVSRAPVVFFEFKVTQRDDIFKAFGNSQFLDTGMEFPGFFQMVFKSIVETGL
jgi:hypothetical protein